MLFELSPLVDAASRLGDIACVMVVLAAVLRRRNVLRPGLAGAAGPELPVRELLPPANAPPGSAGGSS
jgi:hypothetical protein